MKHWAEYARGAVYGVGIFAIGKLVDHGPWWAAMLAAAVYAVCLRALGPPDGRDWIGGARQYVQAHPLALPVFALTVACVGLLAYALGVNPVDSVSIGLGAGVVVASLATVHGLPDPWEERG